MPSNHLILCCPLLLLPSIFPSISVFSKESVLGIRWPKYGVSASASVLPMNTQDWFPLGLTGWISLLSKGLSRVFSNTTVQKQFFGTQLSLQSNSHIHPWLLEKPSVQFHSVQLLSHVWIFVIPWTAAHQASLSTTNSRSLLKFMCMESVMYPTISYFVIPFSCLQCFPASGSFPMSRPFTSGDQGTASTSASVLTMNSQDWFPWLAWSPYCPRDSQESFSTPQFESINSSSFSLLYGSILTSLYEY